MWLCTLSDFRCVTVGLNFSLMEQLRVDTAALQAMASRWGASAGRLGEMTAPAGLGLSCQASAVAVSAAHADVGAFVSALAARVGTRATGISAADTRYIGNEADSADEIEAVAPPVTGV
ncbi:hypothetical protein BN1232_02651 [Mycobacterium lentiflavum]|uniref:PE family protein n=2 Tax=Mycobacterium lentiflavum TaxID=141349 RepID=A0A0E3WCB7_MYCLN|nr:hypothetical protein BN1232_02651 [Mycobacterium lentiflavum]